jgi:hypothetical protein
MKFPLLLSTLTGIVVVLMLVTNPIFGQGIANQSQIATEPTIELLKHKITKGDFSDKLIGQVKNTLDDKVSFVKIIATFYDVNGDLLGTESTYTDPSDMLPQMKAPFEMTIDNAGSIASYDITITWKGSGSGINAIEGLQN